MNTKSVIVTSAFSLIALVIAACGQIPNRTDIKQENGFIVNASTDTQGNTDPTLDAAAIIAEVKLENGNTLRFIDEGLSTDAGGVGMLELTLPNTQPLLATVREENATPLEVFLMAAPHQEAPEKLLVSHQAQSKTLPRSLTLKTAGELQTQDGGVLFSWCSNSTVFHDAYRSELHFPNNFKYFGFGEDLSGKKYGVTGTSNRRALSVCNHLNAPSHTKASVWKQIGVNTWTHIVGTSYDLGPHHGIWYASQDPAFLVSSKYRVVASGGYYSIAGSWGQK